MKLLSLFLLASLTVACATTTTAPPEELAATIVASLDAGERGRADSLFASVKGDSGYTDRLYPIVFGAARERFESGDADGAVAQLEFLRDAYPQATRVREALLFAVFLQRAGQETAAPQTTAALDDAVRGVREASGKPTAWVDLIDAQRAIDEGELEAARSSYDRFLASWNGSPGHLVVYVEDVGRYLASH